MRRPLDEPAVNATLKTLAERLDAMSLRERALIFAFAVFALLMLAWWLVTGPLVARAEHETRELSEQRELVGKLQEQVRTLAAQSSVDANVPLRRRIEELKRELGANDATMRERQARVIAPERITGLLGELLAHHRKLELVDLKSMPPVLLTGAAPRSSGDSAKSAAGPVVYRHGVEVTVRGGYQELVAYLTELEALPYQLYWGRLEIATQAYPMITMKLNVHTLGLERAWLTV